MCQGEGDGSGRTREGDGIADPGVCVGGWGRGVGDDYLLFFFLILGLIAHPSPLLNILFRELHTLWMPCVAIGFTQP